jgi:hypothetical protein
VAPVSVSPGAALGPAISAAAASVAGVPLLSGFAEHPASAPARIRATYGNIRHVRRMGDPFFNDFQKRFDLDRHDPCAKPKHTYIRPV